MKTWYIPPYYTKDNPKTWEMVKLTDAEAEIEKARSEGRLEAYNTSSESIRESLRADERERIVKLITEKWGFWDKACLAQVLDWIGHDAIPDPKPLEHIRVESLFAPDDNEIRLARVVNALVDAVNRLNEKEGV